MLDSEISEIAEEYVTYDMKSKSILEFSPNIPKQTWVLSGFVAFVALIPISVCAMSGMSRLLQVVKTAHSVLVAFRSSEYAEARVFFSFEMKDSESISSTSSLWRFFLGDSAENNWL